MRAQATSADLIRDSRPCATLTLSRLRFQSLYLVLKACVIRRPGRAARLCFNNRRARREKAWRGVERTDRGAQETSWQSILSFRRWKDRRRRPDRALSRRLDRCSVRARRPRCGRARRSCPSELRGQKRPSCPSCRRLRLVPRPLTSYARPRVNLCDRRSPACRRCRRPSRSSASDDHRHLLSYSTRGRPVLLPSSYARRSRRQPHRDASLC